MVRPIPALALALVGLLLLAAAPAAGQGPSPAAAPPCEPLRDEPAFASDAEVQTWTGETPENVSGGTLDVQSYQDGAYVVPWNESSWRVEVGEVDPNDELEATVDASTSQGRLDVTVAVEPRSDSGLLGTGATSGGSAAVKAWVPQAVYEDVRLDDRPNGSTFTGIQTGTADAGWDAMALDNVTADRGRIDVGVRDVSVADGRVGDLEVTTGSGDVCAVGPESERAVLDVDTGDMGLAGIRAGTLETDGGSGNLVARDLEVADGLAVHRDTGDVELEAVEATTLETTAGSGNLQVHGLLADDVTVSRDTGDVDLDEVTADTLEAGSGSGDIAVNRSGIGSLSLVRDTGDTDLSRLTADELTLQAGSGDLDVADARIDAVDASFDSGDTHVQGLTTRSLGLTSSSGDLTARGLEAADMALTLDSGDVDADLRPLDDGAWNVTASSGDVGLHVPANETYGYDAVLRTSSGEPTIEIPGTEVVERSEHRLHVRTTDFQDRPTRTHIRVDTDSGDVTADDEVETTDGGFGSGGRTYGVVPSTPEQAAVDAGILAALAAVATVAWPKLRTIAAPLYSRIADDEVLHHPVRSEIHDIVQDEPGIHFRELQRRLEAGRGVLEHHLDKLVDASVLAEHEADGYTCYFVQGAVPPDLVEVAPLLRADTARDLLAAASAAPGSSVNALSEAADVSNSTASYHLDKLEEAGLVAKDRGGNGLEVAPTDLGARALDTLALEPELAVSENRA